MAVVRVPHENRTIGDPAEIKEYLSGLGIDYEWHDTSRPVEIRASPQTILAAYGAEIEALKERGGYVTADVIDVSPETPGLEAMLAKFSREHWHDEDEVRLILEGRGIFHIRPRRGAVAAIEVEAGDLLRVPAGTWHWFDLCAERRVRAIRLFRDPAGWTPHYTESGVDQGYQPVCLGPQYLPPHASK